MHVDIRVPKYDIPCDRSTINAAVKLLNKISEDIKSPCYLSGIPYNVVLASILILNHKRYINFRTIRKYIESIYCDVTPAMIFYVLTQKIYRYFPRINSKVNDLILDYDRNEYVTRHNMYKLCRCATEELKKNLNKNIRGMNNPIKNPDNSQRDDNVTVNVKPYNDSTIRNILSQIKGIKEYNNIYVFNIVTNNTSGGIMTAQQF